MIHTYRTSEISWPRYRPLRIAAKGFYYAWCLICGAIVISFVVGFIGLILWLSIFRWPAGAGVAAGIVLVVWAFLHYTQHEECDEIRLNDDGTCEFDYPRGRVVRMHVTEIVSVKELAYDDGSLYYVIRFRDRRSVWPGTMQDFEDFLTRIKAMNPAIEIRRLKS